MGCYQRFSHKEDVRQVLIMQKVASSIFNIIHATTWLQFNTAFITIGFLKVSKNQTKSSIIYISTYTFARAEDVKSFGKGSEQLGLIPFNSDINRRGSGVVGASVASVVVVSVVMISGTLRVNPLDWLMLQSLPSDQVRRERKLRTVQGNILPSASGTKEKVAEYFCLSHLSFFHYCNLFE